jgi:hypothetical protein
MGLLESDEAAQQWVMREINDTAKKQMEELNWRILWSLLKRTLGGTNVSVEPFHLFRYLDEQAFRYNHRKGFNDGQRFDLAVRQIVGKRLTWETVDREGTTRGTAMMLFLVEGSGAASDSPSSPKNPLIPQTPSSIKQYASKRLNRTI